MGFREARSDSLSRRVPGGGDRGIRWRMLCGSLLSAFAMFPSILQKGVSMPATLFRFVLTVTVCVVWCGVLEVRAQDAALPTPLDGPQAQASYGIGMQFAKNLVQGGLDGDLLDLQALLLGIQDGTAGQDPKITQEQFRSAMMQVQQLAQQRMQQKMQALAERNKRDGPKFIEMYKGLDGVQELPSGLLYKVVKSGSGPSPKATDQVKTHYRGRLVDKTEFDSSYERGQPAVFPVNGVIAGWTEALQKMKVGDKWQLVIPPELAYGENGSPPVIGPNAVLIFDIELLEIMPPQTPQLLGD